MNQDALDLPRSRTRVLGHPRRTVRMFNHLRFSYVATYHNAARNLIWIPSWSLSGHFWIGFDDIEQESDFRWLNGAPLIYHTFPDTEPNEHRTENCGALKNEKIDNTACSRDEDILCSSIGMHSKVLVELGKDICLYPLVIKDRMCSV